jgi:hypothetical protein
MTEKNDEFGVYIGTLRTVLTAEDPLQALLIKHILQSRVKGLKVVHIEREFLCQLSTKPTAPSEMMYGFDVILSHSTSGMDRTRRRPRPSVTRKQICLLDDDHARRCQISRNHFNRTTFWRQRYRPVRKPDCARGRKYASRSNIMYKSYGLVVNRGLVFLSLGYLSDSLHQVVLNDVVPVRTIWMSIHFLVSLN